ncbi:SDR family NAD(P)-dependent oxidoreductase [Labilibacter marinus]|uniref:SDR family NAD(P)-dependent oxidoreductase n=1 Tax=Labilibacter marinus TaxID=1477105 RepID=UPI00094F8297|nr:SDR family NAD(P)-dependent oxidoreductase [Labilibacter marinus]
MKNQQAIITGATSGIGKAYAHLLASQGWHLLLTGRRVDALKSLKCQLENSFNARVEIMRVEFNDSNQFKKLLMHIKTMRSVELLINNAGYGSAEGFFDHSYEEENRMLNVHITAATHLIHSVVPNMIMHQKGTIINVSSLSAFMPASFNYFYCASKRFMVSFSECLYLDLERYNINVQALCPGFVKTDFHLRRKGKAKEQKILKSKFLWMEADEVVAYSLKNISIHKVICIPGFINRIIYAIVAMLPKRFYYWATSINRRSIMKEDGLVAVI